jgi:predicted esterase
MRSLCAIILCGLVSLTEAYENYTFDGRAYKVHVPRNYNPTKALPVVVAFHGFGDTLNNWANVMDRSGWIAAADSQGFFVVLPEHKNPDRNSFLSLSGSSVDLAANFERMNAILDLVAVDLRNRYTIDLSRIVWIGFSEGAHFTDLAAWRHNTTLQGVAIYGGGIPGKSMALVTRKIPLWFSCGRNDPMLQVATASANEWSGNGNPGWAGWVDGVGHSFPDLCKEPGGNPATVAEALLSTGTDQPVIPRGSDGEVLRNISIQVDHTASGASWIIEPGPSPWVAADDRADFIGLRRNQSHLMRFAPTAGATPAPQPSGDG